ncbi:B3 domain-containing transcription factor VRN1-like [Ziziphus jujuba]|uniref:B3 domain-containing transcription factor VRN1-like n=1 Tax=Ziziphus jujuba TaxID=326968 RepID=A0A6P3ZYN6_ZIZJJ|nr:B3 domain-containing transcription factor VRN1-like [Ziziphus jujuba]
MAATKLNNHLRGSDCLPMHFFKIILPSTLKDQKLKIPRKFGKKIVNELSSIATITVPNCHTWKLGLEKANGRISFVDGWQQFVDYHSIASGYFLVFRYEGFSKFHVYIFDKSCTEIDYPIMNGVCNKLEPKKEVADDDSDDDVEILEHYADQQGCKKRKKPCQCATCMKCKVPRKSKNCKLEEQEDEIALSGDVNIFNGNKMPASYGLTTIDEDGLMFICRSFLSSKIKPVISKESERAINAARSCKRTHPSFLVLLRRYNLSCHYVDVPGEFVMKYMRNCSDFIKLKSFSGNKKWHVKCSLQKGKKSIKRITKGWNVFVKDNNLKVDDVCVFELVKHKQDDILLEVSIYYADEYADPVKKCSKCGC